jgi:hypothetical protein
MFILRGTGLAVTSICKGREKGEPHENQFVIVGNPASFNQTTLWTRISAQGLGVALLSSAIQ